MCGYQLLRALSGFLIAISAMISTLCLADEASHLSDKIWSYSGKTGPEYWGDLASSYSLCKEGKKQSPVDINFADSSSFIGDIDFFYQSSPLSIENNGHTIRVNYRSGSSITVANKTYELIQFHFHSPSEHKVQGKPSDMVVHLVHKSLDGEMAVVAVLFEKGQRSPFIQKIWDNMPQLPGQKNIPDTTINASDLLPVSYAYYTYTGSLTTPPCNENVKWIILKSRSELSVNQLFTFTSIFENNIRPLQPLYGRAIREQP
ncbi:MAG: carbonic anhydrase [Gammaproteobacteria bacterium]